MVSKNFAILYYEGFVCSNTTTVPVNNFDTKEVEKHINDKNLTLPYAFCFITKSREDDELDSKITYQSPMIFVNGKVETKEEVFKRNDPREITLRSNMEIYEYETIIHTIRGGIYPYKGQEIVHFVGKE